MIKREGGGDWYWGGRGEIVGGGEEGGEGKDLGRMF